MPVARMVGMGIPCFKQFFKRLITPTLMVCFLLSSSCAQAGKSDSPAKSQATKKTSTARSKKRKIKPDPFYSFAPLNDVYRRQAKRMKTLDKFKKQGWVGESDSGLLKFKDPGKAGKKKALLEKMVAAENADRAIIIKAIETGVADTKENKVFIRRRLFELYREMDLPGTFYFQADHWHQK